jgi:hypothetical protein
MCFHAVVTFLDNRKSLRQVDHDFRDLILFFHRIPYCATFGVSCAGHGPGPVRTHGEKLGRPRYFFPQLAGCLRIILAKDGPYAEELKSRIEAVIGRHEGSSFEKDADHPFGPKPEVKELEMWEIRIKKDVPGISEIGETFSVADNPELFIAASIAGRQIRKFWKDMGKSVMKFADSRELKIFNLDKRVSEIMSVWKPKQKI